MESNTSTTTNNNHQNHNHNEASREEAESELVVRRQRVRVIGLSASFSYSSSTREEIGLSASLSHSSSTHGEEINAEFSFPAAGTVMTIALTISRDSTESLLPTDDEETDDEESLRPPPPDLPIEVIEGLLKKVEVIDNGDVCAICMDELKVNDETRAIGQCSHTFHLDCVAEWVKRKPTCPLCRFEIPINGEGDDDQGVKRRRLV